MSELEFTSRYDVLPYNGCDAECEGTGWVPVADGESEEPWRTLWLEAEAASPTDDGWHFVKCPVCNVE